MKKISFPLLFMLMLLYGTLVNTQAATPDTVYVRETNIPILIDRMDNELFLLRIDASTTRVLNDVRLRFSPGTDLSQVASLKLYYGGTEGAKRSEQLHFSPVSYVSAYKQGMTRTANPAYSVLKDSIATPSAEVLLKACQTLVPGINYFWISIRMKPDAPLLTTFSLSLTDVRMDDTSAPLRSFGSSGLVHRLAYGVRHAGDDGVAAYRIPGLVTTNEGTLLAVYDVRHNSSVDLQEYIEVGLSRSTDKGQTWEQMRIPLSFGEYGGLPKAQNGVGDPAILVDKQTGTIWIMAAWVHGMGNTRAWNNSGQGQSLLQTGQLVLTRSDDDGRTWSKPINITSQVKSPHWHFLLQGPGRGISMSNGTIVFTGQYIDEKRIPSSCILYSADHGDTWHISTPARPNTTESQVAEVESGILMLNMRDNRGGSRAVSITHDMGRTWQEHPSSRKALVDPICMGSLLHVSADENILKRDLLFFSNPDSSKARHRMSIKASLDGGLTWHEENRILLDEGGSWGYSCLTLIDRETIGILYESSTAHILFQAVKLTDLVHQH